MSEPSSLVKQLERLRRVADMQATAHSYLRDIYNRWHNLLTVGALLFSAFLLTFVMVSEEFVRRTTGISPDTFKWLGGIVAAANFSLTLIELAWRPASKAALHDKAVRHYTKIKYRIQQLEAKPDEITEELVTQIQEQYLEDYDLPRIPESKFLKVKRWHLIKVAISRELDKNPHDPIWLVRLKLWKKCKRNNEDDI
ncbi:MAG: hypothetical protein AB1374_10315 [Bacillota bacterium]